MKEHLKCWSSSGKLLAGSTYKELEPGGSYRAILLQKIFNTTTPASCQKLIMSDCNSDEIIKFNEFAGNAFGEAIQLG